MYTIKFQYYSDEDPIVHKRDGEPDEGSHSTQVTEIMEGDDIRHRPFMVHTPEEFAKWRDENFSYSSKVDLHVVAYDPAGAFNKDKASQNMYFELLTFLNRYGRFQKCLVFCAECFIMSEAGQTVDSFNT